MTGVPPRAPDRPLVIRGAILIFGLTIAGAAFQQWQLQPEAETKTPVWFFVISLVLASSMILQFFAKHRRSPLLAASLGIVCLSLALLWLLRSGYLQ